MTQTASAAPPAIDAGPAQMPVVIALGLTQTLAWASSYYLPAILAHPIAEDLGISPGWVFGAFSGALLISAALGPWAGRRIDRAGGRDMLALSNLLFIAGLVLLGFAQNLAMLLGAWALLGIAMTFGLYEAGFATLTGIFGAKARNAITGITLLAGFASTLGWPVSTWLESEFGWRVTCFAWAGAHLLFCLPVNRLLIPFGVQPPLAPRQTGGGGAALVDRRLLLLAFVFAVTGFAATAIAAHLPELLMSAGASTAAAIFAGSLIGPSQVAARLLEIGVLRRLHPLLAARMAAFLPPFGVAILLLFGAPIAPLFAIFYGAGNGLLTITRGALPLVMFGPQGYGLRQGWLAGPARVCHAAAPFIFSIAAESYGANALLIIVVLGALGFAALFWLKARDAEAAA